MVSRKLWPLALAVFVTASGVVHAAPTAADRETARRLMDEGKARLKEKEIARAIDAFQKAHDIMHVPTTGIALAKAHLAAGHLVEARDKALEVARLPHDSADPPVFEAARKHAKELDAHLKSRIPTLRLKIRGGNVVRIAIDDVEIPASVVGEPVAVNPGRRVVSAKSGDGIEAKGEIELAERDSKEIELTLPQHDDVLRPAPAKAAPAPVASTSARPSPPRVSGFGNDDIEPQQGERTPLAHAFIYGGFGVGVVGISVGAVAGAMTLAKASDVKPQCDGNGICPPAASDDLDSAKTLSTVSTIAVVVGLVGTTLGVVGLLLPKRSTADAARSAAPKAVEGRPTISIGPNGVGGTF